MKTRPRGFGAPAVAPAPPPRAYVHNVWGRSDLLCASGFKSLGAVAESYDSRLAEVLGRVTKGKLPNPDAVRAFLAKQGNWNIERTNEVPI